MKITSRQYALALYESIKNKEKEELDILLKNFVSVLIKNNDLKLLEKIISEFVKFCDKADGKARVEIISAKKLDQEIISLIGKNIAAKLDKRNIIINNKINKNILGGIILKYGSTIIDGSFKNKINCLRSKLY
ncbi:MAG: ATP synthase F1 subunit delta [Xanthomonadaceae bacterium]|nr:ATP synthase F1 subunit delta [Rhodospirillaceae bacterium]NIA17761.1 ATP synthase F1 subunit delta [Xanthomonadaceae bacterium]